MLFRSVLGPNISKNLIDQASGGQFGGRALRRAFQSMVVDKLSDRILEEPDAMKGAWMIEIDKKGSYTWKEDFSLDSYLPPAS